ncbi:hypothetical protein HNR46_001364 [Haloferula luteola]|uniref:Uncharacterized protein n=1 Tax=Haloferula luteola TaxID=595692 RepID=A0A840VB14_9BACT|nr:hypothetical protein [Haloferula luteola]MBB5351130.1 hypothetical protein [Haloferula luteola]
MKLSSTTLLAPAALALLVGPVVGQGSDADQLQGIIAQLQTENQTLRDSLAAANRAEKEASEQLAEIRIRLNAMGGSLLEGGDQRLLDAVSDRILLEERNTQLETSASGFSAAVTEYLRQAVASDPQARLRVESAMRELDVVLGLRHKPAPAAQASGTANRANVMSIDSESGLLVLNVGEKQQTRIGSTYRLYRGDQPYGTAIIADVRSTIAGAFVESLEPGTGGVRVGDLALLETE